MFTDKQAQPYVDSGYTEVRQWNHESQL